MVALKHGLLATIIPELIGLLNPAFIVVRRPYTDIERTRARRQWPPIYGYFGARMMYERIYSELLANSNIQFLDVYLPDLLSHPDREIARIADFSGLNTDPVRIQNARKFLRC